ncbi:hypothetical protein UNSWDHB_2997 [Dehalobacter sp. UNSWDHB]|nr:hypothetical protein UNSWDHB_2997 [Dehalobacter sp. UNSWDHB]
MAGEIAGGMAEIMNEKVKKYETGLKGFCFWLCFFYVKKKNSY